MTNSLPKLKSRTWDTDMKIQKVLLDANVLYPAPLRGALVEMAATDLFNARWTADIVGNGWRRFSATSLTGIPRHANAHATLWRNMSSIAW